MRKVAAGHVAPPWAVGGVECRAADRPGRAHKCKGWQGSSLVTEWSAAERQKKGRALTGSERRARLPTSENVGSRARRRTHYERVRRLAGPLSLAG
jgi:hypothetical protein